jgi:5-methylcytosine-specific restriction endonuclease McrA
VGKFIVRDRRYNKGYRWTPAGVRAWWKWIGLTVLWFVVAVVTAKTVFLPFLATGGFGWYIFHRARINYREAHPVEQPAYSYEIQVAEDNEDVLLGAPGERNSRTIPQDTRIAVATRDGGQCVCLGCRYHYGRCPATNDLQYDHKIPWSKGGSDSVNNIQLMCGPCNRTKSAK